MRAHVILNFQRTERLTILSLSMGYSRDHSTNSDVVSFLLRLGSTSVDETTSHLRKERTGEGKTSENAEDFPREVVKAMDGALVAHLTDVCLSIMAPPATFHESTILCAASVLQTLLSAIPDPATWRRLFPGCFAVSTVRDETKPCYRLLRSGPRIIIV